MWVGDMRGDVGDTAAQHADLAQAFAQLITLAAHSPILGSGRGRQGASGQGRARLAGWLNGWLGASYGSFAVQRAVQVC